MTDLNPNIQFDQGPEPKPSYFKLALLAALGVISAILFFSMIGQPMFFAQLMGASVTEYVASSDPLIRVSATVLEPSPLPHVTSSISAIGSPTPTITQAPTVLSISRILYKDGQPQLTGPKGEIVTWACGDLVGNTIYGSTSVSVQIPVTVTLPRNVSIYDCLYSAVPPQAPEGYMWLTPFMSVYNQSTASMHSRSLTVVDRLVSTKSQATPTTIAKSPTPVVTKVVSPSVTYTPTKTHTPTPKLTVAVSTTPVPVKTATITLTRTPTP